MRPVSASDPARATAGAAVAAVAARQHGVITTAQLHACGLGPSGVRDWLRSSRLHRMHRGVCAVGHSGLSLEGQWMAAVLALGQAALLSHRSAAMLLRLIERSSAPVHITVPGSGGRSRRRGLVVHRSVTLAPGDLVIVRGIQVTGSARTLRDLRHGSDRAEYRRALRRAEYLGLEHHELEADGTRSGLERSFLAFCRRHSLPEPVANAKVGRFTVDLLWPEARVVVEIDTFGTHGGRLAFEEDRERDLWLAGRGFRVLRVTDRRLAEDPLGVERTCRRVLALDSP